MSTAMPQVPPRPTRSHDQKATTASSLGGDLPKVPPRPTHRRFDRSISPQRESFAPSPLNEIPPSVNHGNQNRTSLYISESANVSTSDLPPRSSSVTLPTLGQEGSEYAEVFVAPEDPSSPPTQTRNVADDLKLHAPRPSLPTSSAKQRVSAVTRTDSGQAAAFGIGKAPGDDKDPVSRPLKAKASFASQTSNGPDRPPSSSIESEHGIPEIGQRVPMYPNAGDVQAPSPSPYQTTYPPGIGFHNDGSKPRHHTRKSSGRGTDIPFDAYGKHGHGQLPHDRFEKAYYEKHPELLKKETGHYHGPFAEDRPEWAMSSEDLNKIVRDTASRGAGLGTSPAVMGTPTEQIGFQASEEYTSRMSSPRPQSWVHHQAPSSTSQPHVDSPLRKESAAGNSNDKSEFAGSLSKKLETRASVGLESEAEDEDTIHVDAPGRRISRIYGGAGHLDSTEDLGPYAGNGEEDGIHDELGYGAPILASDEVAKEPFGWELQPAVSPLNESRANVYEEHIAFQRSGSASSSRTPSRPASIHGSLAGFRLPQETPLEALDEYEPLFPDGEECNKGDVLNKRTATAPGKLKRPELKNRKFPSQDIWEDTPNSLQYTATVSTPQLPEDKEEDPRLKSAGPGETPEQAFARKQEELAEKEAEEPESFLAREMQHDSYDLSESRSGMKQRFPSRDIWEDSPDSLQLQATVNEPKAEEQEALILHSEKLSASTVTRSQEKDSAGLSPESEGGHSPAVIAAAMKPTVPARPTRSKQGSEAIETADTVVPSRLSEKLKQTESASPALPAKPKPQVPARPSKPITRTSSDNIPLAKVPSDSSTKSSGSDQPAASKPKPPIPSRPVGSKIAALQSGFMMDLNKRLQLGPQAPKKEEPVAEMVEEEKEKGPLTDARKGRARGPARRAPAKSPAPATSVAVTDKQTVTCGLCEPSTLWQIDPDRDLLVSAHQEEVASSLELKSAEPEVKPVEPESELAPSSIAEHVPDRPSDSAVVAEASTSQNSLVEDALAEQSTDAAKEVHPTDVEGDTLEDVKLKTEAAVISDNLPEPKAAGESIQTSTDTVRDEGEEAEE